MSGEGFARNDLGGGVVAETGPHPDPLPQAGEGDFVAAIVRERMGVLAYRHTAEAQVDQLIASGRLRADDATVLKARLRAFAEGVAQGLHVGGEDPPAVRHAMRAAIDASAAPAILSPEPGASA